MKDYDAIYALVVRLDDDLMKGRVHLRRASDGTLLTHLDQVVPAILAGDLASPKNREEIPMTSNISNGNHCHFCEQLAAGYTEPPMCEKHQDLAVLTGHLIEAGQPVTVETVQSLLARCLANGGLLHLTGDDVDGMLSDPAGYTSEYHIQSPEGMERR